MAEDKIYGMPVGDLHKDDAKKSNGNTHSVVETYEGWYSLHSVYRINWRRLADKSDKWRKNALAEFKKFLAAMEDNYQKHEGGYALYHATGHKGDLLFWFLRPSLEDLNAVETQLHKLQINQVLEQKESFVSVIEVSNYFNADINHPKVQARLYPVIPRRQYMCFYPMSKKRDGTDNWYMTDKSDRARLMRSHGMIGKKYEGVINEYTTSACGLDDWEWGITLMGDDAVQFKKIVYEMRFDEVSARFGLFGPFVVGSLMNDDVLDSLFL